MYHLYCLMFIVFRKDSQPSFVVKALIGSAAGCIGAFVGTPAEVALIRMTADGRLPLGMSKFVHCLIGILPVLNRVMFLAERRNYKNVFNALIRIVREEGVLALWRGTVPTMGRAMVVNAAQLASYSQTKEVLVNTGLYTYQQKMSNV